MYPMTRILVLVALLTSCSAAVRAVPVTILRAVPAESSNFALEGMLGVSPAATRPSSSLGGCTLFPKNNVWNTPIAKLPVHAKSSAYLSSIGTTRGLHADFGSGLYEGQSLGIPFIVVPSSQPGVKVTFEYDDESDHALYPIPKNAPIEGGSSADGDRHILMVRAGECKLYEVGKAYPNPDGSWKVDAGAIWDLKSNALRPSGWTSADAAGLPILPGLVRHDEVAAGVIKHAIRFTAQRTQKAFVWPARHQASSVVDPSVPPMGARFRLKASFNTSSYPKEVKVILEAMKTYGLILADNGSNWFISGTQDEAWNNDILSSLSKVKGSDFEAVDTSSLLLNPDSGEAKQ